MKRKFLLVSSPVAFFLLLVDLVSMVGVTAAVVVFNFYVFDFYLFRLCSKYKEHINIKAETNVNPSKSRFAGSLV